MFTYEKCSCSNKTALVTAVPIKCRASADTTWCKFKDWILPFSSPFCAWRCSCTVASTNCAWNILYLKYGRSARELAGIFIIPIYKTYYKTNCSIFRGTSLFHLYTKFYQTLLPSRLKPYADEVNRDHQCGFLRNPSAAVQIFCIRQTLEKIWEYNDTVHQILIAFKTANGSVRSEEMYSTHWIRNKTSLSNKHVLKWIL